MENKLSLALDWVGYKQLLKNNCRVAIKPNFTYPVHRRGVTTTPSLLESLIKVLHKDGVRHISIVESDGGLNAWSAEQAFAGHGIDRLVRHYGVRAVNLSQAKKVSKRLDLSNNKKIYLALPEILLDEIDLFINLPVMKTHTQTGVSLGLKNLWGCIPTTKRLLYHSELSDILITLANFFKPAITIIDALWAMDGMGPMYGDTIKMNTMVVSNHTGAAEISACRIMDMDFTKVEHLRKAKDCGMLPDESVIEYNKSPQIFIKHSFESTRDLRQTLVHYGPFKSRVLSYLIYLSPLYHVKDLILSIFYGKSKELDNC